MTDKPDLTAAWKAARDFARANSKRVDPVNEHGETLSQCETRFIREFGPQAEREANRHVLRYEGLNHEFPRNEKLVIFYRVIARLVRIDHG